MSNAAKPATPIRPDHRDDATVLLDLDPSAGGRPSGLGSEAPTRADEDLDDGATVVVKHRPIPEKETRRIGEYELVKELGRGGWGTVYKALHSGMGRMVALKLLHSSTGTALKRFDREIHVQARLRHPHICPAFDSGMGPDGRPYLVMDYIEGQPLSKVIQQRQLSDRQLAGTLAKVARALHHAHQRGILHRDIKPDNILLDRSGQPFVVDFGIARDQEDDSEALTRVGQVVGTPFYIAPEQIRSQTLGPQTDVWALGVVLYTALNGTPPFRGRTDLDTLDQVLKAEAAKPERTPAVPSELWSICQHCLQKDPANRYPTALDLARDLDAFRKDLPVSVAPAGLGERLSRVVRHRQWPLHATTHALASFAVVSVVGALVVAGLSARVPALQLAEARQWALELFGVGGGLAALLAFAVARALAVRPAEPDADGES